MENLEMWQIRLLDEKNKLEEKITKLGLFLLRKEEFEVVQDRDLLLSQFHYMKEYANVLQQRIDNFNQ